MAEQERTEAEVLDEKRLAFYNGQEEKNDDRYNQQVVDLAEKLYLQNIMLWQTILNDKDKYDAMIDKIADVSFAQAREFVNAKKRFLER